MSQPPPPPGEPPSPAPRRRPWWKKKRFAVPAGLLALLVFVAIVTDPPETEETAAQTEDDTPEDVAPEPTPEPEPVPDPDPTPEPEPDVDWLAEYHASFGCGDTGWMECFDATNDPVGAALAMRVMSVNSIESPSDDWYEVHIQDNDPDEGAAVCTYVRNLFMTDGEFPGVHVFGADGSQLARTYMLDGNECRAS